MRGRLTVDTFQVDIIGPGNTVTPAIIRPLDVLRDTLRWYTQWFPKMFDLSGDKLFEDSHWKVPEIWEHYKDDKDHLIRALEADDLLQGFIIIKINNHVGIDNIPCAYVSFVASAPWNRKRKSSTRDYENVGKSLICIAVIYSTKQKRNQAIELHSLPSAEIFYRKIGFKEIAGQEKDGMKLFRLEKSEALALINPMLSSLLKKGVWHEK